MHAHFDLGVTIEPLLAQHRNECSVEGGGQIGVEDRLYVNHSGAKAASLREDSRVMFQRAISDNPEDTVAHFLKVWLEVVL